MRVSETRIPLPRKPPFKATVMAGIVWFRDGERRNRRRIDEREVSSPATAAEVICAVRRRTR
ncbi:expressed protein [Arabidopsis lyrata subsp. lyrata]|uniref:Expressed protein n=1 Tax=Arabidopsis lyrata subsp. lyrata TaxID=81972 RepID=D7MMU3_ARALL|nr:expressed protein [Arabidopsis lyrata subsp. lyrata]